MIDDLPPRAVCTAVERERRMIEEDLTYQRAAPSVETTSILDFCHFIETVSAGEIIPPHSLPIDHVGFYRKIIARLIEADQLPAQAHQQFDTAFLEVSVKAFAN
ncbi:MAG TPA: hypothetical protein VGI03_14225 [Verrucomicrobiae bacterium]|jgi:hypothetical protein